LSSPFPQIHQGAPEAEKIGSRAGGAASWFIWVAEELRWRVDRNSALTNGLRVIIMYQIIFSRRQCQPSISTQKLQSFLHGWLRSFAAQQATQMLAYNCWSTAVLRARSAAR
jgi:hypothetical protein